tara:strand:+ start:12223 stop:12396 length:174 start_codon:yes stop_codon:yes gene_type:complete
LLKKIDPYKLPESNYSLEDVKIYTLEEYKLLRKNKQPATSSHTKVINDKMGSLTPEY